MFDNKALEPDVKLASRSAYAAGTAGVLANLCPIALYLLLVGVLVGLSAYLGIPVWFVLLGRHLGAST
jgi:hypothetical protein